jgi:PAS domain S-box-containing protein
MSNERTRILLVEDDTAHVYLVCRAFEPLAAEFELTVAVTLADARVRLEESTFDLVISDLRLPDGKGTALLSDNDNRQAIPQMVVTAAGNEEEAVEAMKAGAMDYVVKSRENFADMPHLARRTLREWRRRSEQKRADERLQMLSSVVEQSSEGMAVVDTAGNALFVNEAFAAMHGYTPDELLGKHLSIFHTPEQMPEVDAANKQTLETGRFSGEIWHSRRDGSVFLGLMQNSVLRDESGNVIAMIGTMRDITDRKRMETQYRNLVEREKDIIYSLDLEANVTFINPAAEQILGYTPEELIGMNLLDFVPEESREKTAVDRQRLLETGEIVAEAVAVDRQGRRRHVEFSSTVIHEGGKVVGTQGIIRDVTHRKQAEEELRKARDELEFRVEGRTIELSAANAELREVIAERRRAEEARLRSEIRFQRLFDNLPDFVVVVDQEGKILFANGRSRVLEPEKFVGTVGLAHVAPQDVGRCREAFEQAFATGEVQSVQCETIYDEWLDCRIVPLTEEGTAPAAMIICTDVSDRKHAQAALQRERHFLRRLLDLHERERQVMAYEIHDGFAQQLTGAFFQFQGFRQQQTKDPQAAQKTFEVGLSSLSDAIDETRRLINGLRPPILDEAGIVAAIDYLICEATEQCGLEVEFVRDLQVSRLAPPLETTVFRIVQESLTNVRRHSGSGKAKVSLTGHDDRLSLEIKDWGIGFNPEEVDENHFGLRGIRERARLLGGKAVVDTSLGHGTRIAVDLPLLERISPEQMDVSYEP